MNALYTVYVHDVPEREGFPRIIHLSIKRNDREPVHDWRHLQRIKNEIVGPTHEAIELYPSEARLVDTANQYHLWAFAEPGLLFPVGWATRLVADGSLGKSKQRPFDERPLDCLGDDEVKALAAKAGIGAP